MAAFVSDPPRVYTAAGVSDPLNPAIILLVITFAWISFLLTWLFLKIFSRDLAFAFIGNALAGTGVALPMLFAGIGSDYLHIALMLSMVYLSNEYITQRKFRFWLLWSIWMSEEYHDKLMPNMSYDQQ